MKNNTADFLPDANTHKDCSLELKEKEHFLGNHDVREGLKLPDYLSGLKTIRLGEQAYDLNGEPIERSYYRPLIVHASEYQLYNNIMEQRLKEIRRS